MLAIHLDGAFLTTRACLPYMYKAERDGSHHLYGIGAFQGSFVAQCTLRHRQAWTDRAQQSRRESPNLNAYAGEW